MRTGMKAAFFLGMVLRVTVYSFGQEEPNLSKVGWLRVLGVESGDRIFIDADSKTVQVFLLGIDCPEQGQPFFVESRELTRSLCLDKDVTIWASAKSKSGAYLANVVLDDGRIVNQELMKRGFAWYYDRYGKDPAEKELEAQARASKVGLWADANPVPPWEFRQGLAGKPKKGGETLILTDGSAAAKAEAIRKAQQPPDKPKTKDLTENVEHMVYVIEGQQIYHSAYTNGLGVTFTDCDRASREMDDKKKHRLVSVSEAKKAGYSPCFVCDPPTE